MVRFAKVLLVIVIFNIGMSAFNELPFYTVHATGYTLNYKFRSNDNLTPNALLNTVGCNHYSNGTTSCSSPSALSSPGLLGSAGIFGWFFGILISLYHVAFAPYFVYTTLIDFGFWWGFAAMVSGGLGMIFYYTLALIISGRYFED